MTQGIAERVRFVAKGLDHPEGLCFGPDRALYAGGEAGQVYRIDPGTGNSETVAGTGGFVLGMCADAAGRIYACDAGRNEVLRIDTGGNVETLAGGDLDNPNDCAFDSAGNLFFSESGTYHPTERSGRLHVITPSGEARCVHPGPLHFANGVFLDSGRSLLYVVESTGPTVLAFRADGPSLESTAPVRRVRLPAGTVPDGVACDAEGNVYVDFYAPDQIGVIRPDDSFEVLYRDPLAEWLNRPTNIALRTNEIYFANLGGWHIGAIDHELLPVRPCLPARAP